VLNVPAAHTVALVGHCAKNLTDAELLALTVKRIPTVVAFELTKAFISKEYLEFGFK
jgi:hypothetical protein